MIEKKNDLEMMQALDKAISDSIEKFRNATTGADVKVFITEYEELMFRKSTLVVKMCLKKERHP